MKKSLKTKCRICNQHNEAVDYILDRPVLAKSENVYKHDIVSKVSYSHWEICQHYNIKTDSR